MKTNIMKLASGADLILGNRAVVLDDIIREIRANLRSIKTVFVARELSGRVYVFTRRPDCIGTHWRCPKRLRNNRGFMLLTSGEIDIDFQTTCTEFTLDELASKQFI